MADGADAADFYGSARGGVAARLLRARLLAMWPDLAGQAVLGLGHAGPYLRLWREGAARCIAATPDEIGLARWPAFGGNLACAVEEGSLPFPDLSFDRVLLVHGLEATWHARALLRELWRVLKDDGRLLVVAANRRGMWAHVDSTPFGQGRPYSPGQIERLLNAGLFRIERRDVALFVPPVTWRPLLRSAPLWERAGRRVAPGLAGVTLTEALKDAYAVLPLSPAPRRRVMAEARPAFSQAGFGLDDGRRRFHHPGFEQPGFQQGVARAI